MRKIFGLLTILTLTVVGPGFSDEVTMKSERTSDGLNYFFYVGGMEVASQKYIVSNKSPYQQKLIKTTGAVPDGSIKEYYPNGNIHFERFFKKSLKNGLSKEFDNSNNVIQEAYYSRGKLVEVKYFKDGQLFSRQKYSNRQTITALYDKSGKVYREEFLDNNIAGGLLSSGHGLTDKTYEYDENGQLMVEMELGKEQIFKYYRKNGQLWKTFKGWHNIRDYKEYDDHGRLIKTAKFTGTAKMFYRTGGDIWIEDHFENGVLVNHKTYNKKGILVSSSDHDRISNFFENGRLRQEYLLKDDQICDYQEFDKEGKKVIDQKGPFNGIIKTFYDNNVLETESTYKDGIIIKAVTYNQDGQWLIKFSEGMATVNSKNGEITTVQNVDVQTYQNISQFQKTFGGVLQKNEK